MKQTVPATQLAPLVAPACDECRKATRLVGLEPASDDFRADLCTYQCMECENVQTRVFLRASVTSLKDWKSR